MVTLYTSAAPVKSNTFGRGLFAYSPARKFTDRTVSDEAELLAWEVARSEREEERDAILMAEYNRELERRAEEAAYLDEYCRVGNRV